MEQESTLISIIVPVYNVESYLMRCIESIINQTYRNLEIILVDDGSTDRGGKICDAYSEKDTRIKVLHKNNGGLSSARNSGLRIAKGNYIGFVDGDDYVAQDMYFELVRFMQDDIDITCCGSICVSPKERTKAFSLRRAVKFSSEEAIEEVLLLRHMSWSSCTKLFRRNLFENMEFPLGRISEDVPIVYKLLKKARNIYHIGSAKYFYCYRPNSLSNESFYFRKIDYLLFIRDIYVDVTKNYPQLIDQAEAGYLQAALYIVGNIRRSEERNKYRYIENRVRKLIRNMTLRNMGNPYLNRNTKKQLLKIGFMSF